MKRGTAVLFASKRQQSQTECNPYQDGHTTATASCFAVRTCLEQVKQAEGGPSIYTIVQSLLGIKPTHPLLSVVGDDGFLDCSSRSTRGMCTELFFHEGVLIPILICFLYLRFLLLSVYDND